MQTLNRGWWRARFTIPLFCFLLTLFTTAAVGARMSYNFRHKLPAYRFEEDFLAFLEPLAQPSLLLDGLPFSLALLAILMAHEMGHYYYCLRYGLDASLPYFLPAPTFIGTFGAFIRIRSIIYSRRELFDVGVAGPLAGMVLIVPFLFLGYAWSEVVPGIGNRSDLQFGSALLFEFADRLFFPGVASADIHLHPVARAAWVGVFATALNLLPIGQLDGGHIVYSLVGHKQQLYTRVFIGLLVPLGLLHWQWWIWAVVLWIFARKHPYIHDQTPLDRTRKWLAALALLVFILTFMPVPTMLRE